MDFMKEFLRRHSLILGLLLMFVLTWPIDLSNAGVLPFQVPFAVYIFLGWGFIFASLIMTWLTLGREGVINLLKRYLIWRVDWKWYLVAFFLIPALNYLAIFLMQLLPKHRSITVPPWHMIFSVHLRISCFLSFRSFYSTLSPMEKRWAGADTSCRVCKQNTTR